MAAATAWAAATSAVPYDESFELEDANPEAGFSESHEQRGRGFPGIIGNSPALEEVLNLVHMVAPTDTTVLIQGETGTGKELIAKAIHQASPRSSGPFVKVNCAAIPAALLESELFGHERGAYTGAITRAIGRFERAHRGTLFLDEIGDLPLEVQPKILRALQERQFERLGSTATIHTNVRLICATHRNLLEMIDQRQFRADLFYRVSVFPIALPPLRERPEDICSLVEHFAMDFATRMRKPIRAVAKDSLDACARYAWPGNIRELQNLIERAVILTEGSVLNIQVPEPAIRHPDYQVARTLAEADRAHIVAILRQTKGVVGGRTGAAARLGLPRTTLLAKMRKLGIEKADAF